MSGEVNVGKTFPLYITGTTTLGANSNNVVVALLTGAATLNLPAVATTPNGFQLLVRNNSAAPQTLTVQGNGAENIGAANTASVTQGLNLTILSDHVRSKWQILFGPA